MLIAWAATRLAKDRDALNRRGGQALQFSGLEPRAAEASTATADHSELIARVRPYLHLPELLVFGGSRPRRPALIAGGLYVRASDARAPRSFDG